MRHEIARTPSDQLVYVDLIHSPAVHDIADHPYLLALAKEVLAAATLTEPTVRVAYDLGRPVGHDFVVATTEADTIFYARLHGDELFTRFVKNGQPAVTQWLSVEATRDAAGDYELQTIHIGQLSPPKPGSQSQTTESLAYWAGHAVVLDRQRIQVHSITKNCPY